jgi:hypothetical protein
MIRIPRIGSTAVFLAAWLMPWRPAFKTRVAGSRLKFFVHYRDLTGRHIAKYGAYEQTPTRWLDNYLAGRPWEFSSTSAPIWAGTPCMPPCTPR